MFKRVFVACAVVAAVGCGNKESPTGPSNQNPPPQTTNRSPVINSVQVSPTFGIADLTVFNLSATASDPDGDALTYSWSVTGGTFEGASRQLLFTGSGGSIRATVNVNDGKGGSASGNVDFILGSMRGTWDIVAGALAGGSLTLNQDAAGFVFGSYDDPIFGAGSTDPAEPGRITAQGQLDLRVKIARFSDFRMIGTMDTTGRMISGSLQGSGFTGQPFVITKR